MNEIVRSNLLSEKGYSPYCGNTNCKIMPRTKFNGSQFVCPSCGWVSNFPKNFISLYKYKWSIK